jgi:hypothetical protein
MRKKGEKNALRTSSSNHQAVGYGKLSEHNIDFQFLSNKEWKFTL